MAHQDLMVISLESWKQLGFTTRIINPDRLLDKFTGKEGLFDNSPFDDRTRLIISKSKKPLGILVDKELNQVNEVFLPIVVTEDVFLLDYAQKLIVNSNAKVTLLDTNNHLNTHFVVEQAVNGLQQKFPDKVAVIAEGDIKAGFMAHQDLMVISLESWKQLVDAQTLWLSTAPSTLIIKP